MVIAIVFSSWIGFSTIFCLAFAAVAARKRPLVGENTTVEAEAPSRQAQSREFKAVCATS